MKKLISCILILLILVPTIMISAGATTLEEELSAQMFEYFGGTEEIMQYYPPDTPPVFFGDCVEVDDVVIFNAYAVFRGVDMAFLTERYGDCCVRSSGITYPSHTGMFVRKDGEIYTLQEAWDNKIITDLSPAIGFSRYTCVYPVGDADLDYELSVLDATLVQQRVAKSVDSSAIRVFEVADFDEDHKLTVMDATAIQLKLAKN